MPDQFSWTDSAWQGIVRSDLAFYELHVGTFTREGTFDAVIPRLPRLRELGITAVELMPIGEFPGSRNWGYDGVHPYAAQSTYGGPEALQRLVDACHREGLALFLDVVYNHFGPEGNYLREFGAYFTDRYGTPWGNAVNYDGKDSEPVRDYILDNVRMWLEEFHVDGLRLDAVHAIFDSGARPILAAIQSLADEVSEQLGRPLHIVAESDLNDPRLLIDRERGGCGLSAQWADDFHHALHAFLTGERQGYYADFGDARQIAAALESPFVYAGDLSPSRGRKHGAKPDGLGEDRFVVCLQNHDQVGNRPTGDRIATLFSPAQQRLAAALLLSSPYQPLLFMGEEYGETRPFPFFCSFGDPPLIEAVRQGRRREFSEFQGQDPVPDPQAESTYQAARLTWAWPEGSWSAGLRRLYGDLLNARRDWPILQTRTVLKAALVYGEVASGPILRFSRGEVTNPLIVCANLSPAPRPLPREQAGDRVLLSTEWPDYGGGRESPQEPIVTLAPWECVLLAQESSWRRIESESDKW